MSGDKAVVKLLYRCMLRCSRQIDALPLDLRASHIDEVLPGLRRELGDKSGSVRSLAQIGFRQQVFGHNCGGKQLTENEHKAVLVDRGFLALQLLNTEYAQAARYLEQARAEHANLDGVQFPIGTVFRHKQHGYKGVIYGWDRQCDRPPDWAEQMKVKHDQPFYSVLPDEHDCVRLFRGARTSKYVAQDNIEVLQDERVVHRALMSHFTKYSSDLGRYIPTARIQYEYPGHYQASDSQSCASDSNLLLHDDADHYDDPYADPYEDKSDSQQGRCPAEEAELQNREAAAAAADADADSPAEEAESRVQGTEDSCQDVNAQNEEQGSQQEDQQDDSLPEQSVGTDVKR